MNDLPSDLAGRYDHDELPPPAYTTAMVFLGEEYIGRCVLTMDDWRNATNWRQAAIRSARRTFGVGAWHVVGDTSGYFDHD